MSASVDGGSLYPSLPSLRAPSWFRAARGQAALLALGTWLPTVALAGIEWLTDRRVPIGTLLHDFELHVRLLVAVPLLILVRRPIATAIRKCVEHFTDAELVARDDRVFVRAVDELRSDARSRFADMVIFAVAILFAFANANRVGAWGLSPGTTHLGWAGSFYAYVAAPIHQFLLYRWVYRWIGWDLFLVRTAGMKLRLQATHADRCAGLSFLTQPALSFALIAFASSTVLAARWAADLARSPGSEAAVRVSLLVYVGFVFTLAFAPLLVHVPRLVRVRRDALHAYGSIAQRASVAFDERWRDRGAGSEFLEANDPSAMADLSTDFAVVRGMHVLPVSAAEAIIVLLVTLVPLSVLGLVNQNVARAIGQLARALV